MTSDTHTFESYVALSDEARDVQRLLGAYEEVSEKRRTIVVPGEEPKELSELKKPKRAAFSNISYLVDVASYRLPGGRPGDEPAARPKAEILGSTKSSGTVKWFDIAKGYGFVQPDDGGKEIFVHLSAVQRSGLTGLTEGQRISFDVEEDPKVAVNLSVLD